MKGTKIAGKKGEGPRIQGGQGSQGGLNLGGNLWGSSGDCIRKKFNTDGGNQDNIGIN